MNRLLLVFVCSSSFFSQVFADDDQTTCFETVYEVDQLDQTKGSLLLQPLVQTNQIEQAKEEQAQVIFQKGSGKIKVHYQQQIFPSITVPFTTDVMQTFKQGKRPTKGRRPVLMWHTNSPIQHPLFHYLHTNKLLMGGAFVYDRSTKDSF
ncbi:hypothetical protein [uncultured Gimesia sp.]|uniref:hypothetical protein n=1 Tax=uncultured Gimesia sp. TaxID=1678688 RepID=UPI002626EDF5|nr:hypothetical protein [uncultured Gimesia sp.]